MNTVRILIPIPRRGRIAAAVALAATLAGCSFGPRSSLAPVEDHTTKIANATPPINKPAPTAKVTPLPGFADDSLHTEALPPSTRPTPPPTLPPRNELSQAPNPVQPGLTPPPPFVPASRAPSPSIPSAPPSPNAMVPSSTRQPSTLPPATPTATVPSVALVQPPIAPHTTQARQPSTSSEHASASSNGGVLALLGKADDQAAGGQLDSAAVTLERALRIEPENGQLWHELAGIRLKQDKLDDAISIAQKSNSLARNQRDLQARNWRLIAVALQKQGKSQASAEALIRARSMEGTP